MSQGLSENNGDRSGLVVSGAYLLGMMQELVDFAVRAFTAISSGRMREVFTGRNSTSSSGICTVQITNISRSTFAMFAIVALVGDRVRGRSSGAIAEFGLQDCFGGDSLLGNGFRGLKAGLTFIAI